MPSSDRDNGRKLVAVPDRAVEPADQPAIERICASLISIDASLSTIIGARGVNALYQRSLHLAAGTHPWLAALHDDEPKALDIAPLKRALAGQDVKDAMAAGDALLETFHQLLTSLIGPSLTERLLRSESTDSSGGTPAQDPSP